MPRTRARTRLGDAIRGTRTAAGLSQDDLAAALGVAQPRISDWEVAQAELERGLDFLAAIDAACGRTRGHVLRRAGYIDDVVDVRAAIADDPGLDAAAREAVLGVYDVFRRRSNPSAIAEHIPDR